MIERALITALFFGCRTWILNTTAISLLVNRKG